MFKETALPTPITFDDEYASPTAVLRDENVKFMMQHDWKWFVTHTFADHISEARAWKKWEVWIDRLNKAVYGRMYRKRGTKLIWCCATEYQTRGVIHYHALIAGPLDGFYRAEWARQWREVLRAGRSRVDPAKQNAAMLYIAKYVSKESHIEYSDNFTTFTPTLIQPSQS